MKPFDALKKLPDLLLRGRLSLAFDRLPLSARHLSWRQRLNLAACGMESLLQSSRMRSLPPTIMIEPTNTCTLNCPLCPAGSGALKREKGIMAFETFKRIMEDLGDTLIMAILYGWGEPFLNRDLPRMIEECTKRNITTVTTTNGQCIQTLDEALAVVDAGLGGIIIALDGSTQDIYQVYRQGGDIEKVKRCAALLEEAKRLRGVEKPYTNIRAVVMQHNKEDLAGIERLARELGVNMLSCKDVGMTTHEEEYRDFEPDDTRLRRFEDREQSSRHKPRYRCIYAFRNPIVFQDGTVAVCEFDKHAELPLGNIRQTSFREIWNTPAVRVVRRRVNKNRPLPPFCRYCPLRDRGRNSVVLSKKTLRPVGRR